MKQENWVNIYCESKKSATVSWMCFTVFLKGVTPIIC